MSYSCVLAKIHMVTKLSDRIDSTSLGCVLAKIHMVTKLTDAINMKAAGCVLAKIHMVTKPHGSRVFHIHPLCSSKNPYGNKTTFSNI